MAEKNRNSVFAVMQEVTEGTPVVPAAVTDYVPLQDGFTIEPAFEQLENNEIQATIGMSKSIVSSEKPTASTDSYLKHSGTAGTAPDASLYYKAALGDISTAAAEYNTVAGSTSSIVNVDTGEGASFERGEALLAQDATNGYGIRNISSISTDAITINTALAGAPAAGVELGKAVLYKPGESHPTLTLTNYRANGGAIEMISGARVSEMSIAIVANEFINGSFSFQGIKYYFNPIEITASNKYIDLTDDTGTILITLTEGTYKDPADLAAHIQTVGAAAVAASGADDFLCTYSNSTGKLTISTTTGTTFSILWKTGTKGSDNDDVSAASAIGFADAADDTGSTSYTSDSAISFASPYTPTFQTTNPLVARSNEVRFADEITCRGINTATFTLSNEVTPINDTCEDTGVSGSLVTSRTVTCELAGSYTRYDGDPFYRMRTGETTQLMYNAGIKSGGNWVPGKCLNLWIPEATITNFSMQDNEGLVDYNMTLTAFVDSSKGEFFINFI